MLSLTATELPKFMACNGFTRLGGIEPFNPSTEVTDEGNAAHWLCEQVYHGENPEDLIGQKAFNGLFITDIIRTSIFFNITIKRNTIH